MNTKAKIILSVIFLGIITLIGAGAFLAWFSPGGIRSSYPAKDNDPKLSKFAQEAMPIIQKIESFKRQTGNLPATLKELEIPLPQLPRVSYTTESDNYMIWIKLGWDPSLIYSSQDRSWTFDPGDGSETKKIKLDFEPVGGSDG